MLALALAFCLLTGGIQSNLLDMVAVLNDGSASRKTFKAFSFPTYKLIH